MGSVVHDFQAKLLKTSPAEFPTLCPENFKKKSPREGGNQKRKNLGP